MVNPSLFLLIAFSVFQLSSTETKSKRLDFTGKCKTPPAPEFAKIECNTKSQTRIECRVKCNRGYEIEKGRTRQLYRCDGFHGEWEPTIPSACQRKCKPRCENEGKCVTGNRCICPPGYRGKACEYEVAQCNTAKLGFDNYKPMCNHSSEKSICTLECPEGMQFVSVPVDVYECSVDGVWTPPSAPACKPINTIYATDRPNFPLPSIAIGETSLSKSSGVCSVWGKFHYRTFDGTLYSFRGSCTYLLAKDCLGESFNIHIRESPGCDEGIQCTKMITIYVGDKHYNIENVDGEISVKYLGNEMMIPGIKGTLRLEKVAHYLIVTSSLGFRLKWDGKQTILLSVEKDMRNKTCGLCGQYDGSATNDFETLNHKVVDNVNEFVQSWVMPRLEEKCLTSLHADHGCRYKTTEEKATAGAAEKSCYAIYDERYVACHEIISPEPYFAACKVEVCECKEQGEHCRCDTLAEYFRECIRLGGKIHGGWRGPDVCPLDCPAGMEYTDCGSSCPRTCKQAEYECDNEHCIDGCHCHAGMHLHKEACIPEDQCPCMHGDDEYLPGKKIPNDCNQCECLAGRWECTENVCDSRCTSTGDSHYKSFDGHKYQFKGKCSYYLVHHDNFTITQDNSLCTSNGLSKTSSLCKKAIIIDIHSTKAVLKYGKEVTVNGQDINKFPFMNKQIRLQKTSSAVLLDIVNGVSVTWDGTNNIFIDAPASLIGTIQGLCGTFNHNTNDDFSTADGAIEVEVDNFAEKWKTGIECKEEIVTSEQQDPCEIYKENEDDAHRLCSVLKSEIFKDCHHEEDLTPFYKDCLSDMCKCTEEAKNCLCPVLANYAAACMKHGVTLNWRQQVNKCEIECDGGQIYQECSNPCTYSCKSLSVEKCDKKCVEGCACSSGSALSHDGVCIPISQCPCYHEENEYQPGSKKAINGLYPCECINGRWDCTSSNFIKGNETMAHEAVTCDAEKNMVYRECINCPVTCQNHFIQSKCDTYTCRSGCSCNEGFVLDTYTESCIKKENCGCWHGGKRFPEGSSYKRSCNKCNCLKGKWICEHKECPGVCRYWGESHFKTFDGHYFDFQGICEYVLVEGNSNDGNFFQIILETKICGTNGLTCAKGIKVKLGDKIKLILSHDKELPKPSYDSHIIVRKVGLSVLVYTKIGMILQWDGMTRISVHMEPIWKGKLSGLCGNFNDDQADDFKTPAHGPIEARPTSFGHSWKLNSACPFPKDIKNTCEIHPYRKSWAKKKCSVMKSDLFQPCHKFVPLDPFYERCIFDTGGCDLGGDCECFCTALAAYVEECVIHGIAIAWRSQDLCPIQCNEDEKYEPCMSTCPKETCETKFLYNSIKKVCSNEPCVEGCEPKPCPSGQIYNNDREFKCILKKECEIPCEFNGRLYKNGEQVLDNNITEECQICYCKLGKIVCTSKEKCPIKSYCHLTGWSSWMNSPSTDVGDYELLNDPYLQKIYSKSCTLHYMTEIQCRTADSHIQFEYTGQQGICKLPHGFLCKDDEQINGLCKDYEIRVFCQCVQFTTEIPTTTLPVCLPGWTQFFNTDSPNDGEGDHENVENIIKTYGICIGGEISDIECKALIDGEKVNYDNTGDYGVTCKTSVGSYCSNHLQINTKRCKDYAVRLHCKCETIASTTPIPSCGWTNWINIDKPKLFKTDPGDMESIEKLQEFQGLCRKPELKDIRCRDASTQVDWKLSPQNKLVCNTDIGFRCYNRYQIGDCYDYEIRVYCWYDWCTSSIPTVISTIPTIPTTGTCPPGQYYDKCAYMCNQTCSDYLHNLHQGGICETEGDLCIPTCRPYRSCEYPFLWKDSYTCVDRSECSCVMLNGDIIQPGEVIYFDCEECQCSDNIVKCVTSPKCTRTPEVRNLTIPTQPMTVTLPPVITHPQGICPEDMTLENIDIDLSQITVSSQRSLSGKNRIQLNGTGAWVPSLITDAYVQIDFGTAMFISAIVTQGENGAESWVTKYSVKYSLDGKAWYDIKEGNSTKIFDGNFDSDTPVTQYLPNMIKVRYVLIKPIDWHVWIAMRLGVLGCLHVETVTSTGEIKAETPTSPPPKECTEPMLFPMKNEIPPGIIIVSSSANNFSGPNHLQINTIGESGRIGGWKAAINDKKPFIQIDFQQNRNLSGVVIQGQGTEDNWVTSFKVEYSTDVTSWRYVNDEITGLIFRGNTDRSTNEKRWFSEIITARYLKILPESSHGAFAMKLEVLGCFQPTEQTSVTMLTTLPLPAYCPELPETLRENCPYCISDFVCDGYKCVYPKECPCYKEGRKYLAGEIIETSDCHECQCRLRGKSSCEKKKCSLCPEGKESVLTTNCQCECRCTEGTIHCPSDDQCIDKYRWCDGKIDCADDEVDCIYTTSLIIPSTTEPSCIPILNENAATCELSTSYFKTFDGKEYELDVCNHVLFREKQFPSFSVTVNKESTEENRQCGRYLVLEVDYFIIRIGPGPNTVVFNDVKVPKNRLHLLSKRYKEFILRTEGTYLVFISLKHGFKITWDAYDNVKIQVSNCLLNMVDGLCGYYDGIKENDFQKPDGTVAPTVESFVQSWSKGASDHCIKCVCDYHTKLAAEKICDSIEEPMFEDCKHAVDVERQRKICIASACECLIKNYTATQCTCQILEDFLHTCEDVTELVMKNTWRIDFSCVPECPSGLEWIDCGPSCELTCDNFQDKNLACSKKCTPGCFCPPGLVRKDDRCIDAKLCHDCICLGYGDPNYQTFDHKSYAFQGSCTYVLVHHQKIDNHPNLEIYVTNTECPEEPGTTCTTGLKLVHNNNVITIVRNQPVKFNEQILEDVVYNFYQDGINITATKEHVTVYIAENNLLAQYIVPNYGYIIKLPSKLYFNETAGLCGVCNFDAQDDFYHRNGYISDDINDFAYSWLVNGSKETCTLVEIPPVPIPELCVFEKNECEIYVDPAPYIKACKNDVSYSHNVNSSICHTILQYASSCCEYGVILDDWIKSTGCEVQCPDGMKFQCKSLCQLTCSNYQETPADCKIPPEYLCSCPENQVMKDGECVDPVYCEVCDDEGHGVGEHWNVDLCQSCECLSNMKVVCQNMICPVAPICPVGTSLQTISNGTCCEEYECQPSVCPPTTKPVCEFGAIPQLITIQECPEYHCVCNFSLCNPLKNISHLEPGEVGSIKENGCCKELIITCNSEECPLQKNCGIGSELIERKGTCCTLYSCLPLEKCIYKHRFDTLKKFENESTLAQENTKLYEVGETWTDGLCIKCRCDKESEQFIPSCETEKCTEPPYVINQIDYFYEPQSRPESCCPDYIPIACRSNGTTYQVGDEWPSSDGNKCISYKCIKKNENIEKVETILPCNKSCPAYTKYIEPSPESLECCGYCEPFACEDDGIIYEVGDEWPSGDGNKCISYKCIKKNEKIEKIENIHTCNKSCPAYTKYIEPSPESLECCGYCEPFACEDDGIIYEVGAKWIPQFEKCMEATCVKRNNNIEKIFIGKQCPMVPPDCPEEYKTMDESGCCHLCSIIPGACEVRRLTPQRSVHYFFLHDRVKGKCSNKDPVENLTECSGRCNSDTAYSLSQEVFTTICNCCIPRESVFRQITLNCDDNSTIIKEYVQPTICDCVECPEKKTIEAIKEPIPK
uniref:Hemocytin n=1 Tax=Hadrurus spadix TaxID=141984 RepID=A0A1W7RAG6_9SCOR